MFFREFSFFRPRTSTPLFCHTPSVGKGEFNRVANRSLTYTTRQSPSVRATAETKQPLRFLNSKQTENSCCLSCSSKLTLKKCQGDSESEALSLFSFDGCIRHIRWDSADDRTAYSVLKSLFQETWGNALRMWRRYGTLHSGVEPYWISRSCEGFPEQAKAISIYERGNDSRKGEPGEHFPNKLTA